MSDMLKIGDKKETIKFQTPGQPSGLDLQIDSGKIGQKK